MHRALSDALGGGGGGGDMFIGVSRVCLSHVVVGMLVYFVSVSS